MAVTLDERVAALEHDMAGVKSQLGRQANILESIKADVEMLPDLVKLQGRLIDSKITHVRADMAEFKSDVRSDMATFRGEMNERFDVVVRVLSEIVAEKRK